MSTQTETGTGIEYYSAPVRLVFIGLSDNAFTSPPSASYQGQDISSFISDKIFTSFEEMEENLCEEN